MLSQFVLVLTNYLLFSLMMSDKSFVTGGALAPNEGFKGAPRLNEDVGFGLVAVPEGLKEPPFLTKLLFGFSITTEFFP